MKLDDLPEAIGLKRGEMIRAKIGDAGLEYAYGRDPIGGKDGWWWAAAHDGEVFALGWTSGDRIERQLELGTALAVGVRGNWVTS